MNRESSIQRDRILGPSLAFFALIAWTIPLIGAVVAIAGLIVNANLSESRKHFAMAVIGMLMCGIGLVGTIVNGYNGAVKGYEWGKQFQQQIESDTSNSLTSEGKNSDDSLRGNLIACAKRAEDSYRAAWTQADSDGDNQLSNAEAAPIEIRYYDSLIDCEIVHKTAGRDQRIAEIRLRRQRVQDEQQRDAEALNTLIEALGNLSQ